MPVRTVSHKFIRPLWEKIFKEWWRRPTTADLRSSFWQILHVSNVCLLEEKIQDWGMYLFRISYGSFAVDQRSGDGWFSGWSKIFVFCKRNSNARLWSTRTESSLIPKTKERSGWRNKGQTEDRFVRGRQIAYLIYEYVRVTGANDSVQNYADLFTMFFEMMIFRSSTQSGTEFYCLWRKSHLITSWKDCTNKEYESLRNSRPYWNCMTWRFIIRKQDLITDWRRWWYEVSSNIYESGVLEARNGKYEKGALVKNQGTKQRGQRTLRYCWQWKTNGQCS